MSFIDLKASDVWSNADIDNRVQSLIRSRFTAQDELKAARLARKPDATEAEAAFVAAVDGWIAECVEQGHAARADMALLAQVIGHEQAAASAKQAHEAALAWNESLVPAEPEEGEEGEGGEAAEGGNVAAEPDLPADPSEPAEPLEPVEPPEPVEVPDLLADPAPGDEIHDLWLARNPPAPEVVEPELEAPALLA